MWISPVRAFFAQFENHRERLSLRGVPPGSTQPAGRDARSALVPYLDLFGRLGDEDLSKLSGAPLNVVSELRRQIEAVQKTLGSRRALLPELSDAELVKITGEKLMTIRFWRLTEGPPEPEARPSTRPVAKAAPARAEADVDVEVEVEEVTGEQDEANRETVSGDPGLGASLAGMMASLNGGAPGTDHATRPPAQWAASSPQPAPKPPAQRPLHGQDEVEAGFSDLFGDDY